MSFFEAIGNFLCHFVKVDEAMPTMGHSNFSIILVDMDASQLLPRDVVLMVGERLWTQALDYESPPYCCRYCFSARHMATDCTLLHQRVVDT